MSRLERLTRRALRPWRARPEGVGIAGAAFGPLPFAASVDWAGSYAAVLIGCCMLCIVCGAGAFAVKRPFSSAESMMNCKMGATP